MRKYARASIAAVLLVLTLTGCSKPAQTITLYQSSSAKVERTGASTIVKDLITNEEYTFTSHRSHTKGTETYYSTATLAEDTETLKLETVYNLIILEDKQQGATYYIR